jgi:hypothetical protein
VLCQLLQHRLRERAPLPRQPNQGVRLDVLDDLDQVLHVRCPVGPRESDFMRRQGVPSRVGDQAFRIDHEDGRAGLLDRDLALGVVGDGRGDRLRDPDGRGTRAVKDDACLRRRSPLRADAVEEAGADYRSGPLDVVVEAQLVEVWVLRVGKRERKDEKREGMERRKKSKTKKKKPKTKKVGRKKS